MGGAGAVCGDRVSAGEDEVGCSRIAREGCTETFLSSSTACSAADPTADVLRDGEAGRCRGQRQTHASAQGWRSCAAETLGNAPEILVRSEAWPEEEAIAPVFVRRRQVG